MPLAGLALALTALAPASAPRPAPPAGSVWIVDDGGGPGVDFTEIHQAVAAAADGDVVLVRDGTYAQFVIAGKGLVVQRDGPGVVRATSPVVGELLAGQHAALRGLTAVGEMKVVNNQGSVWIEDCAFVESSGDSLEILTSVNVVVTRCTNQAAGTTAFVGSGGAGVRAFASKVTLHDCEFRGATGYSAWSPFGGGPIEGGAGGDGAYLADGEYEASRSFFYGGLGGDGGGCFCFGGPGGDGVHVVGSELRYSSSFFFAGPGGGGYYGGGPSGLPLRLSSATAVQVSLAAIELSASSPVVEGTQVDVVVSGPAGLTAYLGISATPAWIEGPLFLHPTLIGPEVLVVPLGPLGAGGVTAKSFPVGLLPPGLDGLALWGQALLVTAGGLLPGGMSSVVVVDASL